MPLSALQQQFAAKLAGGQFRSLNERLYTQSGSESLRMMREEPELFTAYHAGFRAQVGGWPRNPLDVIIGELQRAPPGQVIGDFGCGDARLGSTLGGGATPHAKVHSFDLVAPKGKEGLVTACDMSKVPLPSSTCDTVVFCLSLMGTNYFDFLKEGVRVLKPGGRVLIAEIQSRFEGATGMGEGEGEGAHQQQHQQQQQQQQQRYQQGGGGSKGKPGTTNHHHKRPRVEEEEEEEEEEGGGGGGGGKSSSKSEGGGGKSGSGGKGLAHFISALTSLGLSLVRKEEGNKMFIYMQFKKGGGEGGSQGASRKGLGVEGGGKDGGGGEGEGKKKKKKKRNNRDKHYSGEQGHKGGGGGEGVVAAPTLKACVYKKR